MLYALFHDNVVDVDGRPVDVDAKLIGHYSSLEKARSARARACRRPGFGAFVRGFRIELVECMDCCNGEPARAAVVYRNYLSRIDRDACVECWFFRLFSVRCRGGAGACGASHAAALFQLLRGPCDRTDRGRRGSVDGGFCDRSKLSVPVNRTRPRHRSEVRMLTKSTGCQPLDTPSQWSFFITAQKPKGKSGLHVEFKYINTSRKEIRR